MSGSPTTESDEEEPRIRRRWTKGSFKKQRMATTVNDSGSDDGKSKAKDSSNKGDNEDKERNKGKDIVRFEGCRNKTHGKSCQGNMEGCHLEFVGDLEKWRAHVRQKLAQATSMAASSLSTAIEDNKSAADSMEAHASSTACDDTQPELEPDSQLPDF